MSKPFTRSLIGLAVLAFAVPAAHAQDSMRAGAAHAKTFLVLTPEEADPLKLLPPPPADGSATQKAELAQLREIQQTRTPERLARAQDDDAHGDVSAFSSVLGSAFDLSKLPATRALLDVVVHEQSVAADLAKTAFHRHRPWTFDPGLTGCSRGKTADPLTSYPSGHVTVGYTLAVVLSDLEPREAPKIMARAADFAQSRLVCEVHYPSDLVAGQVLGTAVAVMLLHEPALRDRLAAARAELSSAGLR